jgi:hypothetical protein
MFKIIYFYFHDLLCTMFFDYVLLLRILVNSVIGAVTGVVMTLATSFPVSTAKSLSLTTPSVISLWSCINLQVPPRQNKNLERKMPASSLVSAMGAK